MTGKKQYYVVPIMLARQRRGQYEDAQDPKADADIKDLYRRSLAELKDIYDVEVE